MMMPMSVRPGDTVVTLPEDTLTVFESDSDVEGLQVVLPLKLAVEFTLPRWVSKMKGLGLGLHPAPLAPPLSTTSGARSAEDFLNTN